MKKIISLLCVFLLVSCNQVGKINTNSKIDEAMSIIKDSYLEKKTEEELVEGAVKGMVTSLNDPFSEYFSEKEAKIFYESLDSSFEGIGVRYTKMPNGDFVVLEVIENSPALKSGIAKNDIIIKVNGESVVGISSDELVTKIKGKKGTEVKVSVMRGSEELEFTMMRDTVINKAVKSEVLESNGTKIGYIKISGFTQDADKEFKEVHDSFIKDGIKEILIDVRDNGGGYLSAVQNILEEVLPKGVKMYGLQSRENEKFVDVKKGKTTDVNYSVLTNGHSASASELLAGSFKDNGYLVYGEKSFGKGTVQTSLKLKDGSVLKLTIQQWLTPKGEWIHKKGVEPTNPITQNELFKQTFLKNETSSFDHVSDNVKTMQIALVTLGYTNRVDGYFDQKTVESLKDYQSKNSLESSGELDEPTIKKINASMYELINNKASDSQLNKTIEEIVKK